MACDAAANPCPIPRTPPAAAPAYRGKPALRAERPRFSEPALHAGSNPTARQARGSVYKHTRRRGETRQCSTCAGGLRFAVHREQGSVKFDSRTPSSEHPAWCRLDDPDDAFVYDDSDAAPSGNLANSST